ncbi:MAG: hypothetical protein KJO07_23615, partial [Deltaproteobacteria bacterium]|nr:hypothetical protein [Deltaproteobacteria bacterium]
MSRPELLLLALSVACVDPASSPDAGPADAGVGFPQRYDLSGPFGGAMCRSSMLATSTGVAIIWEQFPTGAANEQVVFSRVASDGSIEVQPTRIYDGNIRDLWLMPDGDDFVVVVDSFVAGFEAIGVDGAGQVAATNSLGGIGSDANFVKTDGQYWAIYRRSISAADDKIAYRTFDAPGTNLSAATDLAPAIAGVQRDPHVDVDGDGVWSAFVSGSVVHLQKTDSTGTPLIADQEALPELNSPYVDVTASSEGVLLMAAHYPGSSPERVAHRTFD